MILDKKWRVASKTSDPHFDHIMCFKDDVCGHEDKEKISDVSMKLKHGLLLEKSI
jgi:hypothetical protein